MEWHRFGIEIPHHTDVVTGPITLHSDTSFQTTIVLHSHSLGDDDKSNTAWVWIVKLFNMIILLNSTDYIVEVVPWLNLNVLSCRMPCTVQKCVHLGLFAEPHAVISVNGRFDGASCGFWCGHFLSSPAAAAAIHCAKQPFIAHSNLILCIAAIFDFRGNSASSTLPVCLTPKHSFWQSNKCLNSTDPRRSAAKLLHIRIHIHTLRVTIFPASPTGERRGIIMHALIRDLTSYCDCISVAVI